MKLQYAKVTVDGSWLICRPEDVGDMTTDLMPSEFEVEIVEMTQEEFEGLPEFQGW